MSAHGTLLAWELRRALRTAPLGVAIAALATLLVLWAARDGEQRPNVAIGLLVMSTTVAITPSFLMPAGRRREPPTALLLAGCSVRGTIWARGVAEASWTFSLLLPAQLAVALLHRRPPRAVVATAVGFALFALYYATIGVCVRVRIAHGIARPEGWRVAMSLLCALILAALLPIALGPRLPPLDAEREWLHRLAPIVSFAGGTSVLFLASAVVPALLFAVETTARAALVARRGGTARDGEAP